MYKFFPAIALCMALQPAWATGGPGGGVSGAGGQAPPALVQISLATPGQAAAAHAHSQQAPVVVAALQDDAAPPAPEAETERETNQGVLLAALALMAGIVLRRWGTGRR